MAWGRAGGWGWVTVVRREGKKSQSCPTLRDPMDCSPPGSTVVRSGLLKETNQLYRKERREKKVVLVKESKIIKLKEIPLGNARSLRNGVLPAISVNNEVTVTSDPSPPGHPGRRTKARCVSPQAAATPYGEPRRTQDVKNHKILAPDS